MIKFLNKFKIPTLLGFGVILAGLVGGVYLAVQNQGLNLLSKAALDLSPQNITISNIEDESLSVSWQTASPVPGFITYGQIAPTEQTATDDRDLNSPKLRITHHVTLKKLTPQTTYQIKIISGKFTYNQILKAATAPQKPPGTLKPIIGSVVSDNQTVDDGLVYLTISGVITQSAVVKDSGNFIIPLSGARNSDLSNIFNGNNNPGKLTVVSSSGKGSALIKLGDEKIVGPLRIGQDLDLTTPVATVSSPQTSKYDLNGDGQVNAADYSIVVQNKGKNPQDKRTDLNGDKIVDKKDLDLMMKQVNQVQ